MTGTSSRFRPLAPIGRGGMAEVLLALMDEGAGFDKVVVLKRIWPDLAADPDFVTMFRDEAWLSVRMRHANVVRTHEVIDDGEQLAIAMEYLHGQSLTSVLTRLGGSRQLSLELRIRIVVEILAGLHYVHELTDEGGSPMVVVHRDVSPGNVFVTYDGRLKLMDFGVAKTAVAGHRTRPGAIKGKLAYLAPECVSSEAVDRRVDIFSAGVMLWELLAGRRLWHGMSEAQIVSHLATGIRIPRLPADFGGPPALEKICARALAINPDERYATAAQMRADLRGVLVGGADLHARMLGGIVTQVFSSARAGRDAMIAGALETGAAPQHGSDWAKEVDALLPDNESLDRTVADEYVEPRVNPALPARLPRHARGSGAIAALAAVAVGFGLVVAQAQRDAPESPDPAPQASDVAVATGHLSPPAEPLADVTALPLPPEPSVARDIASLRGAPDQPPGRKKHLGRRVGVGRRGGSDGFFERADDRAGESRLESSPFEEQRGDVIRIGVPRAIDEGDPFK